MKTVDEIMALVDAIVDLCAGQSVDRAERLADEIKAALEEREDEALPVYQLQRADGSWIDQAKSSYDYNIKHQHATVRIVYTAPPKAQPMSDEQADQLADLAFTGYMQNTNDNDARELVRLVERHHKIGE